MHYHHYWASLARYRCPCPLLNPLALLALCAFLSIGEDRRAACHGRFLHDSKTCLRSQACLSSEGVDRQMGGPLVGLDAPSCACAGQKGCQIAESEPAGERGYRPGIRRNARPLQPHHRVELIRKNC
jgi:hypothetical protein